MNETQTPAAKVAGGALEKAAPAKEEAPPPVAPEGVCQNYNFCEYLDDPTAPQYRNLRVLFHQHLQSKPEARFLLTDPISTDTEIESILSKIEI